MMVTVFSENEMKVLTACGYGRKRHPKRSIADIVQTMYPDGDAPNSARNVVSNAIKSINSKTSYHRLPFFLNGSGGGRGGRTIWIDKK